MANEIQYRHFDTGDTLYAVFQREDGQYWNETNGIFETVVVADWITPQEEYGTVLDEVPVGSQQYDGDVPASLPADTVVRRLIFVRLGATQVIADYIADDEWFKWNGTEFVNVQTDVVAIQSQVNNIGSGATGGTHVEATFDNTTRDTIDNAGADLKGGGLVGIPVTGHSFVAGREITIAGSVAYNGAFDIVSQTANEVVITHAQTAEAFTGAETIVSSIKGEIFVGTVTAGTFANVSAANGALHSMDDDGDDINIVYGYNVGGSRQATEISIFANLNGNTDEIKVKVYDFVGDAFDDIGTLSGSGGSSFAPLNLPLLSKHTGTGTEIGDVFILFDTESTTPSVPV